MTPRFFRALSSQNFGKLFTYVISHAKFNLFEKTLVATVATLGHETDDTQIEQSKPRVEVVG